MNRYNTMNQSDLIQEHKEDIVCTYEKNLVRAAKNAVRSNTAKTDLSQFVMEVSSLLKNLPQPGMKLGFKYTIRYNLMMLSPRLFQSVVRNTAIFSAKRHTKARLFKGAKEASRAQKAA